MKNSLHIKISILMFVTSLFISASAFAHDYRALTIDGSYRPSDVGTFPVTSSDSWLWYEFIGGGRFSWFYGAGTDGGVIFNKAQTHPPYDDNGSGTLYGDPGELGSVFLFLNDQSVLYSTGNGIQIDTQNTIDMSNLRLFRGLVESDIGAGVINSLVPLVADINSLPPDQNGWQVYPDNSYDLVFYTRWQGSPMGIHFHGNAIPARPPTTSGFWPGHAQAGEFVFVFGAEFEAEDTQVEINGIPAPIAQVMSPDMLIFQLPAGDTAGPIRISTHHGIAVTDTDFGQPGTGLQFSGIWPGQGARPGEFVFIFGSGFAYPVDVSIGSVSIPVVQVVSEGMLILLLPQNASSGAISITVNGQTIVSPSDYTVLP